MKSYIAMAPIIFAWKEIFHLIDEIFIFLLSIR